MIFYIIIRFIIHHKCLRREEITEETNTTEVTSEPLSVSTAVDIAQRTSLWKGSPSETLLINRPKKICKKIEPLNSTSFPSCILKCSIVSVALSIPESSRLDPPLIEEADSLPKESREMPQAKSKLIPNDLI